MADVAGKMKRKRDEDRDPDRKKKKVAIGDSSQPSQSNTIRISSIRTAKECPPILATSPGLCIPANLKFQAYSKPQPNTTKRSKHEPPSSSNLVLRCTSHPTLDYTAEEYGASGRETYLKHYVGVFDPATGQLSVIEARKMGVRGVVRAQQPPDEETKDEQAKKSLFDMRRELGQAFGTKKAKKALAAITENAIAPDKSAGKKLSASSQAMMESMKEASKGMATKEQLQALADAAKPVPPGNFDAEEIQDVYTPEGIIGTEVLRAIPILDWQDAIKKKENQKLSSSFIANRLSAVAEGDDQVQRLRTLRYLDFLIKFAKSARPGRERGTKRIPPSEKLKKILEPAPEPVVQGIRHKFSASGEMRKFHTDLVYTHCCALAAILANYRFDTSHIRFDLGLDEKQFAQYFREIGGKILKQAGKEKGTQVQIASLALPLEFPQMRFQRSSKRR